MDLLKDYIPYYLYEMVDIIGRDKFLDLCKIYGGTTIYIPVYKRATQGIRNEAIFKEYNGKNIDELRVKYNLSNHRIRELLRKRNIL
ncbi:Mor transcription activator family protein [Terrisporobacter sp.]